MIDPSAGIAISVASFVTESTYEEAVADFESAQLPVRLQRRDPEVFAAFQYLMPTAVVIYILTPYVAKFMSMLAEDNYNSCKSGLKKLWSSLLAKDRAFRVGIVATGGKVSDSDLSLELSFASRTADDQSFRLLLPDGISASDFKDAILTFYSLMREHDRDPGAPLLNKLSSDGRKVHIQRVLTWVPETRSVVEIDIIESSKRKARITVEIPTPPS